MELWLAFGGQRIDASQSYNNQRGVGRAINNSDLSRDEVCDGVCCVCLCVRFAGVGS